MVKSGRSRADDDDCSPPAMPRDKDKTRRRSSNNGEEKEPKMAPMFTNITEPPSLGARFHQQKHYEELEREQKKLSDRDRWKVASLKRPGHDMAVLSEREGEFLEMKMPAGITEPGRGHNQLLAGPKKNSQKVEHSPTMVSEIPSTAEQQEADNSPDHRDGQSLPRPGAVAVPGIGSPHNSSHGYGDSLMGTGSGGSTEGDAPSEPPLLSAELVREDIVQATAVPKKEWWRRRVALLAFSAIVMGSSARMVDSEVDDEALLWTIILSSVALAVVLVVMVMFLVPEASISCVRTKSEGILYIALVGLWTAITVLVNNPNNNIGVGEEPYGAITAGNIYYFSWAGFLCSVMLAATHLKGVFQVATDGMVRFNLWCGMLIPSVTVMAVCANEFDEFCGQDIGGSTFCRITKFGIALGASAVTFSLLMVGLKISSATSFVLEATMSVVFIVMYSCGAAYVTSSEGPGAIIGNLYYSIWVSLLLAVTLGASCFEEYQDARKANGQ